MADYQLSYSGEEIDNVCEKIGKFRVGWGHRTKTITVSNHATYCEEFGFGGMLPEEFESSDKEAFIFVGCDYGGEPFDMASTSYVRNGRDVTAKVLIRPGDPWPGWANRAGEYTITVYCLVVYREDNKQSI